MEPSEEPPAKRARIRARRGASCRICRTRKLKCDGLKPSCSRCIKSGDESGCVYDLEKPDELEEGSIVLPNSPTSCAEHRTLPLPPSKQEARIIQLERTVAHLQRRLLAEHESKENPQLLEIVVMPMGASSDFHGSHSVDHPLQQYIEVDDTSKRHCTLGPEASFRTFFWGHAYWGVAPCGGLNALQESFLKDVQSFKDRHPTVRRATKELIDLDSVKKATRKMRLSTNSDPYTLWKLLPERSKADKLIELYLNSLENLYHIVHVPSFKQQYAEFWKQPAEAQTNSPMTAIILLMVSCVICVDEAEELKFVGDDSLNRTHAVISILACDDWIQSHSQKHLTAQYFRIKCLLLVAKTIAGMHIKRWYHEVGSLIRQAMSIGLHLEVEGSKIGKLMSDFDKEMRRRIWAVICELEITICLLRGLPSALQGVQTSCKAPSLIFDDEITCPTTGPVVEHYTRPPYKESTYLVHASRYRSLRLDLVGRVNSPTFDGDLAELLRLEDETRAAFRQYDLDQPFTKNGTVSTSFARVHFKLEFLRLLLLMNRHAAVLSTSESTRRWATHRCIDFASQTIYEHMNADEQTCMLLTYLHTPSFTAAISLTLDLAVMIQGNYYENMQHNSTKICDLIEYAVNVMETRALRLVGVYRRYWFLLTAFSTVKMRLYPEKAKEIDEMAAAKLTSLLYKIISAQVPAAETMPHQLEAEPLVLPQLDDMFDQNYMANFDFANFDLSNLSNLGWDVFSSDRHN